jgi:ABC-type glycerol-3-phosphate transport system substrate-binding protein
MHVKIVLVLLILALSVAGCNRGDDESTTTTSSPEAVTTTTLAGGGGGEAPTESTEAVAETTTTIPLIVLDYDVRFKGQGDGGAIMVVEVPQGEATDRSLENLLLEVLDVHDPVAQLDVVDDPEAVELVRLDPEGLTEEEQQVLAEHHLLSYEDGFVTFTGPFEDVPGYVYGS